MARYVFFSFSITSGESVDGEAPESTMGTLDGLTSIVSRL